MLDGGHQEFGRKALAWRSTGRASGTRRAQRKPDLSDIGNKPGSFAAQTSIETSVLDMATTTSIAALTLVQESKISDLLPNLGASERFEASGVLAKGDDYFVV